MLLIRLRSLGDAILTLPLIEALHEWRPDLHLDVLIEAPHAPVLQHPAVHEILMMRARQRPDAGGWSRLRIAYEIRKRHYPVVLNLHGGTTSMLFTLISGARLRIGQAEHRSSWIYSARIPSSSIIWKRPKLHTVEHQLSFMRWLELPTPIEAAGFLHADNRAKDRIRERLARFGISVYFLIQPSATLASKQWSSENYARLGDLLFRQFGRQIIYTAGLHETDVLRRIREASRERHIYWSDLPLCDLIALIEGCRLFIGNDSGPTHAASALGKPLVVIWGSSNFHAWRPWGTEYEVVRSELPCMPCPGYTCTAFEEPRCILDIPVSQVAEACERILQRTERRE
jgi:ADP-heptose:LPS heptosyltransferase